MTDRTRAAIVGFALAHLYLLSVLGPLVSPQHELIFHLPGSAANLFVPVILDVLIVWGALFALLYAVRHHPRRELLLWSVLLLMLPSGLVTTGYGFSSKNVPAPLSWSLALGAALIFFAVNLRYQMVLPHFSRMRHVFTLAFALLALPESLLFAQLLWYGWQARNLNPPFRPAAPQVALTGTQVRPVRVVWILLDELSFDQVFGHRYPGLDLPNFDRFAAQGAVFTNAIPAAEYTRQAMPAMFTGQHLRRTQPSASGQRLQLVNADSGKSSFFTPEDTVFGDARRAGIPTAIAGWYEPYCRLFSGAVDRCFWTYSDELPGGLTSGDDIPRHVFEPFSHFVQLLLRPAGMGPVMPTHGALDVRRHRADYLALLAASDDLLRAGQPGLVFLHMPIPHPWGFYDRRTGTFPNHRTSYLDNLVLADAYLGRVRGEMEANHVWDDTNVVIMGDHSWRTATVWAGSAHWTAEEQAASHGGAFDDRPAVMIKLSKQATATRLHEPFDAVRTRSLLDGLMSGSLSTPASLEAWVARGERPSAAPSSVRAAPTHE